MWLVLMVWARPLVLVLTLVWVWLVLRLLVWACPLVWVLTVVGVCGVVVWCRWWCRVGVRARCVVRLGGCGSFWRERSGGSGRDLRVEGAGLVDVAFSLAGRAVLEDRGVVLGRRSWGVG